MKVMLIKDVYKLGRAGDIKKVADGFGRNFLLPKNLAVLATPGTIKQVDRIRSKAVNQRTAMNNEFSGVAEKLQATIITFAGKAGETGKLYGSINAQMIAETLNGKLGTKIERQQIEIQPIRQLGEYKIHVHLTSDLLPEVTVIVYREGEPSPVVENTNPQAAEEAATE